MRQSEYNERALTLRRRATLAAIIPGGGLTIGAHAWLLLGPETQWRSNWTLLALLMGGGLLLLLGVVAMALRARDRARMVVEMEQARADRAAAETANAAKTEFLANMSHEIRTPMTAILGYADMLERAERDPSSLPANQRREAIRTIARNGEHLLRVLDDILDISKIDSGRMAFDPRPCSTIQIIEDVASLMRARATEAGITLEAVHALPLPRHIVSDPLRLRQILLNLVGNAVKFTQRGGVTIRHEYRPRPTPQIHIEVRDTGVGIEPSALTRIFEPFQQADTSTSRVFGGTGLGLAICKRLVSMLEGDIRVESRVGEGSSFTLALPTGCEQVELIDSLADGLESAAEPIAAGDGSLAGTRILLAEDGRDNQRLIGHMLTSAGADLAVASDGVQAVDVALEAMRTGRAFDVILMDMQMPQLDGYEATRRLRNAGVDRPIVALTAHAMRGDRERCLDAGCDDYATKPVSRARLLETCLRWANNAGDARAA